jgi:hypothetical protein
MLSALVVELAEAENNGDYSRVRELLDSLPENQGAALAHVLRQSRLEEDSVAGPAQVRAWVMAEPDNSERSGRWIIGMAEKIADEQGDAAAMHWMNSFPQTDHQPELRLQRAIHADALRDYPQVVRDLQTAERQMELPSTHLGMLFRALLRTGHAEQAGAYLEGQTGRQSRRLRRLLIADALRREDYRDADRHLEALRNENRLSPDDIESWLAVSEALDDADNLMSLMPVDSEMEARRVRALLAAWARQDDLPSLLAWWLVEYELDPDDESRAAVAHFASRLGRHERVVQVLTEGAGPLDEEMQLLLLSARWILSREAASPSLDALDDGQRLMLARARVASADCTDIDSLLASVSGPEALLMRADCLPAEASAMAIRYLLSAEQQGANVDLRMARLLTRMERHEQAMARWKWVDAGLMRPEDWALQLTSAMATDAWARAELAWHRSGVGRDAGLGAEVAWRHALAARRLGDPDKARLWMKRALARDPRRVDVRMALIGLPGTAAEGVRQQLRYLDRHPPASPALNRQLMQLAQQLDEEGIARRARKRVLQAQPRPGLRL